MAIVDAATVSGELAIPYTAAAEARRNARRAVQSAAKDAGAPNFPVDQVVEEVRAKIAGLRSRFGVEDDTTCVEKVRSVYAGAWTDERLQGAIEVRRIVKEMREKDASMPTPEKNWGDFTILSTAACLAGQGLEATLPTFDQDFVAFAVAIREGLGVDVVDCGRLGR